MIHEQAESVNRRPTKDSIESGQERPAALTVRPGNVPAELRGVDQWVGWRYERRNGKWTKVPIDPKTGKLAKTSDPGTWGTFEQALAAWKRHGLDGIGFVFTEGDEFAGVDLDDCRDAEKGEVDPWAQEIINELGSYSEISPSGTGVKVFLRGKVPPGGCRKGKVEMYDHARFFCVTGRRLKGSPAEVKKKPKTLARLHAQHFPLVEAEEPGGHKSVHRVATLDDHALIEKAKAAKNGANFARLWAGDTGGHASRSEADLALSGMLAFWAGPDPERIDRLFRQSGLMRDKWLRDDYRQVTIARALEGRTEHYKPGDSETVEGGEKPSKDSQSTQVVKLVLSSGAELFHDADQEAYITLPSDGNRATGKLRSKRARQWLGRAYYERHGKSIGSQALQDALNTLEGHAIFDGLEHRVHIRVAEYGGKVYLDLGDPAWRAVEVDADGWRLVDEPPVKFRRAKALLPLPVPVGGGSLDELRQFVNARAEDWPLLLAWLAAALRPTGPYPALCVHGEQGSAKSTTSRLLRSLVDPNVAPARAEPKEPRDLAIAANNSWVVCLDNLSFLTPWLSDALCRLSTGGGFATRALYTDEDESIFDGQRPIVLNGIAEVATRGDLLDRALLVTLPTIPAKKRRTECELWSAFEEARPRILGALLDAVSAGLRNLASVKLSTLPRMADFALWATASEPALGLEEGAFLAAYRGNVRDANEIALGDSALVAPLWRLVEGLAEWRGSATELLSELGGLADEKVVRSREWPRHANRLSGQLRRLAPNLRRAGLAVEMFKDDGRRVVVITREEEGINRSSRPSRAPRDGRDDRGDQRQAISLGEVPSGRRPGADNGTIDAGNGTIAGRSRDDRGTINGTIKGAAAPRRALENEGSRERRDARDDQMPSSSSRGAAVEEEIVV